MIPPSRNPISEVTDTSREVGRWSTELFDCVKDEETCWWGTWCCWILNARTIASFELNSSLKEILVFWSLFVMMIFFLRFFSLIGFTCILLGISYLAYRRASFREKIREKLLIPGSFSDDFVKHICCTCCAICQEAREANETSLLVLDYCSGERIEMQEIAHDIATGRINSTLQTPTTDDGGTFWNHLINISQTSKIILVLCTIISILSFTILFITHKEQNLIVLFLTFLQPILILYFVYWRSRRQYATLDMVIKLFAVGFWLTTFQSIVFEEILQTILMILLGPFIATSIFSADDQNGDDYQVPSSPSSSSFSTSSSDPIGNYYFSSSKFGKLMKIFTILYSQYSNTQLNSNLQTYNEYNYETNQSPDSLNNDGMSTDPDTENATDDTDERIRQKMKNHLWIVIIVVFSMAFIVAAGVEETMKHFSVRCCRFPAPLTDPHTILVYLMASALGFATSENIEYVFGASSSPIPGTSLFVGELIVLFVRVLMPIHVICSVIQAANLSKVLLGQQRMSLFMILLPAILLHGLFDFVLMFIGVIQYIYGFEGIGLEIASFVIALCLTIGGAFYAYFSFQKVQDGFLSGWQTFEDEESTNNENERL